MGVLELAADGNELFHMKYSLPCRGQAGGSVSKTQLNFFYDSHSVNAKNISVEVLLKFNNLPKTFFFVFDITLR